MKVLIADDEMLIKEAIEALLTKWGYEVVTASDGNEAWEILRDEDAPRLAILDWMMPGLSGPEICRKVRKLPRSEMTSLILLTSKGHKTDIVAGLEAGANDYIIKPFDYEELRVRVQIASQMVKLQTALADRVEQLEKAMMHIKMLQGFLPICSYCKKIRNDQNYWQQLETYFSTHSDVQFSHGICPECYEKHVRPEIEDIKTEAEIGC
ncbi:response regulator [Desulfobacterales bacterium HSG2]|nr:response regulator [Desulfobacterales bacterium HSG2]